MCNRKWNELIIAQWTIEIKTNKRLRQFAHEFQQTILTCVREAKPIEIRFHFRSCESKNPSVMVTESHASESQLRADALMKRNPVRFE